MIKKRTITLVLAALFVLSIFTSSVLANEPPPEPPPVGDQGCTPGFWKNHTNQWYVPPESNYSSWDLWVALHARGKGSKVERHGAAALLNAWSEDVAYSLSPEEVEAYIAAHNGEMLRQANEAFCPLGGRAWKVPPPADPES